MSDRNSEAGISVREDFMINSGDGLQSYMAEEGELITSHEIEMV